MSMPVMHMQKAITLGGSEGILRALNLLELHSKLVTLRATHLRLLLPS